MIGTTIDGKYLIRRELGAGAMGKVYEAEHAATGRRVALKLIISPELVRDQAVISRFQREARAAGSIETKHITQVLDAGVDPISELPFLVMEYMSGEDVQGLIKRVGPLSPDLALRIVAQGCLGLQKAHEAGVVHRDMKPANLFLAKQDAGEIIIKVLDFGIAKVKMDQAQDAENAALTKTGSMIGSPLYMSPEQARGQVKHIDHRTDIWSMGIVLYQCLCGHTPYAHVTALGQLILAICNEWPKHIQEEAPWVAPEIAAVVHRCLRHNPNERYQSANEMFQAVRALLPHGWNIMEEMVVPLQDTMRNQVTNKLSLSTANAQAQTSLMRASQRPPPIPATADSQPGSGRAVDVSGVPVSATAAPTSGSKLPLTLGVVALLAAGGGAAWFATRPKAPVQTTQPTATATATAMVTATATATATASATAEPVVDKSMRRVKVVILPVDAQIEIEGEAAKLNKDGLLEISGTLGSVHRVHVHKGKLENTTDVIVTQDGASPPKIEVTFGAPKPSASAAATTAPTVTKGIVTKFE